MALCWQVLLPPFSVARSSATQTNTLTQPEIHTKRTLKEGRWGSTHAILGHLLCSQGIDLCVLEKAPCSTRIPTDSLSLSFNMSPLCYNTNTHSTAQVHTPAVSPPSLFWCSNSPASQTSATCRRQQDTLRTQWQSVTHVSMTSKDNTVRHVCNLE